jgi:hypothetical protein
MSFCIKINLLFVHLFTLNSLDFMPILAYNKTQKVTNKPSRAAKPGRKEKNYDYYQSYRKRHDNAKNTRV